MTSGDRTAQHTDESDQLIFPLLAEPSRRPPWAGMSVAAGVVVAALAVAVAVAVHQARIAPDSSKSAIAAAGADERTVRAEVGSMVPASVFELKPGTCLRNLDMRSDVQDVPVVPCTAKHWAEVIATVQIPEGPWPGRLMVDGFAVDECVQAIFEVGIEASDELKWSYFGPTESSWTVRNDRTVSCVIVSEGQPLEGSLVTVPAEGS